MLEIRKNKDNSVTIEGYVNAICRDSRKLHDGLKGEFVEQVMPNVWTRALQGAEDVKILYNHDSTRELGSIKQGNLELREDAIGLKVKASITDEEVIKKAENRELTGWSFGFSTNKDSWEQIDDNLSRRYLKDINLYEVSILSVTPAYFGTVAEVRSEDTESIERRFTEDEVDFKEEEKRQSEDKELKELRKFLELQEIENTIE